MTRAIIGEFVLLCLITLGCRPAHPPTLLPVVDTYLATGDQARIHYQMEGTAGDTLVVLHGGPGLSAAAILPDLRPLAAHYRLLAYDQRGGGYSTVVTDPARLGIDMHVADLEALRQKMRSERLTLVAHSWGGAIAIRYALAHPEHVARLILIDIIPPRATPYFRQFLQTVNALADTAAIRQREKALVQWAGSDPVAGCRLYFSAVRTAYYFNASLASRRFGNPCAGPPEAVRNFLVVNSAGWTSMSNWDWRADVQTLRIPVLLIHGDHDPMPLAGTKEWASTLPNARLVVIRNSGHYPFVEQPNQFYDAVEAFLRGS